MRRRNKRDCWLTVMNDDDDDDDDDDDADGKGSPGTCCVVHEGLAEASTRLSSGVFIGDGTNVSWVYLMASKQAAVVRRRASRWLVAPRGGEPSERVGARALYEDGAGGCEPLGAFRVGHVTRWTRGSSKPLFGAVCSPACTP